MKAHATALDSKRLFRAWLQATIFVLGAIVWALMQTATAQTGDDGLRFAQRSPGLTASNMAVAGTGVAGVWDASAFFTNPAGLGWAKSSYISASLTALNTGDDAIFEAPGSRRQLDNDITASGIGSFSYLFKVPTSRGAMVVGAGISQVSSFERSLVYGGDNNANSFTDFLMPLTSEFVLEEDGDGVFPVFDRTLSFMGFETFAIDLDAGLLQSGEPNPFVPAVSNGTVSQSGFVDESGRMMELNVGGAIEVAEDVMIGLSLNVPFGTYTFSRVLEEDDFRNDNDGTNGTTDFDFLRFNERVESEIVGVNLRLGLSAKVNEDLKIGVSIETPTYYSVEDNYSSVLSTWFDNGDSFNYGGQTGDAGTGSFDYNIITPWKLSVGASYTLSDLVLSADFEVIDWSQMELDSDRFAFADENIAIVRGLDAVVNTRLGVSWSLENFQLSSGLALYPDPHSESLSDGSSEIDRDRVFLSAGVSYKFSENIEANVSWIAEQFEDRYDVYSEVTDAPFVSEEVTRNRFQIGFTFAF